MTLKLSVFLNLIGKLPGFLIIKGVFSFGHHHGCRAVSWFIYNSAGSIHQNSNALNDKCRSINHNKIIDIAKNEAFNTGKTVNEIAYELGFKYPQHFTRLFKNVTGFTPHEYRSLN
ncbi:MAG TPA: hypothetical protein DCL77_15200 [Prolixibacteraceae bacterium]|nr:hypothetical protein [Prolixibacteraceae bacterium]